MYPSQSAKSEEVSTVRTSLPLFFAFSSSCVMRCSLLGATIITSVLSFVIAATSCACSLTLLSFSGDTMATCTPSLSASYSAPALMRAKYGLSVDFSTIPIYGVWVGSIWLYPEPSDDSSCSPHAQQSSTVLSVRQSRRRRFLHDIMCLLLSVHKLIIVNYNIALWWEQ